MVFKPSVLRQRHQLSLHQRIFSSLCLLLPAAAKSHLFDFSFVLTRGIPRGNSHWPSSKQNSPNIPHRYDFTSSSSLLSMAKLDSPSAQRNKHVIWEVISRKIFSTWLKSEKPRRILEIAAGCGVHVEYFSSQLATLSPSSSFLWYPTDLDESSRKSIECYIQDAKLEEMGVQPPMSLTLDENGIMETETSSTLFPMSTSSLDLMICINMIHISPWSATLGLMKLAGERLDDETGVLFCYGPYKETGTAVESNL